MWLIAYYWLLSSCFDPSHSFFALKTEPSPIVGEDGKVTQVPAFSAITNATEQYQMALNLYQRSARSGNTEVRMLLNLTCPFFNFLFLPFFCAAYLQGLKFSQIPLVGQAYIFIGDMHYHGLAVPADHAKAAEYYRIAADARLPQAMYNLGYMHQQGQGLTKDFYLAKRYFDMVSSHQRGSKFVGYAAVAMLGVQWAFETILEVTEGDTVLIVGLGVMLAGVLMVLVQRRMRQEERQEEDSPETEESAREEY